MLPPAGEWARKTPAEVGMDAAKLNAVEFMKTHETIRRSAISPIRKSTWASCWRRCPPSGAAAAGLIIQAGYIVAEFGDPLRPDPTYSVAKSMLATIAGIALERGLITSLDSPVGDLVKDGGYDTPHNRRVTWRNHLQQVEWEGEMWGKNANFIGARPSARQNASRARLRPPGTFYEYNDVRMNRFALSLLRVFKKPIPDVFRDEVMNPIGASSTWKWVPYTNAYVDIDGKRMASVAGRHAWGGGMWISTYDMARFGLLWLRQRKVGRPSDRFARLREDGDDAEPTRSRLWIPLVAQHEAGAMAWIAARCVQRERVGQQHLHSPSHDLVVVWRWSAQSNEGFRRVVAAITS